MNEVLFQETAKLSKPVPPEKVIDLHKKFLAPSLETSKYPPKLHKTWGTIVFMIAIYLSFNIFISDCRGYFFSI